MPIDSSEGKRYFSSLAQTLLYKTDSAAYNQSIMDFGATVCKPQIPQCEQCVLMSKCAAYRTGMVDKLPVKEKRLIRTHRWFYYFIFNIKNKVLINKRTGKGIWENLHEFFLHETAIAVKWSDSHLDTWIHEHLGISEYTVENISPVYKQQLTHQVINGQFLHIELAAIPKSLSHLKVFNRDAIRLLPFPKFINQHLESTTY
jgi:A/G-specific adenine glycosylase